MMGYAQIQGSFTLDGSLINLAPFEQVKRKAVVGGQGGGVIGVETTASAAKRDSGLLRGFGWGNIGSLGSSLGELLAGGGELSTIKEMRGVAGGKAVPLLSTPQSILFVDLKLVPGESRAYEYIFRLPRGLPPTHRGKAVKISYGLVIGTQRAGGAREQQVRTVDVPFRVLGSVNSHGEILGHDLMNPYVLLRDQARVRAVHDGNGNSSSKASSSATTTPAEKPSSRTASVASTVAAADGGAGGSADDFFAYVEELLMRPRQGSSGGLLSPTATDALSRRASSSAAFFDDPNYHHGGHAAISAREAIDLAVLRSNVAAPGQQSPNRFEIARDGRRVAVVMLARPACRLGDSVSLVVDFAGAEIPCYAVHSALETAERIDPSLAVRSDASVHRVTRRVHATASEAALSARRLVFAPTLPVSATPEFVTSGVSLEWKIRLEFVVPASSEREHTHLSGSQPPGSQGGGSPGSGGDDDEDDNHDGGHDDGDGADNNSRPNTAGSASTAGPAATAAPHPLLEEISNDEKGGLVLVAVENLACESFEVAVPLRVYGAVCAGLERLDWDEALEEGLPI
jgi:hypothetical protein